MLKVTADEFLANQQRFLDRVDAGEELMLQRAGGQRYLIVPADDVLADVPPEYILEPDEDLRRAISFEEFRESALAHIEELFRRKS